jgi:hypothetical protein
MERLTKALLIIALSGYGMLKIFTGPEMPDLTDIS